MDEELVRRAQKGDTVAFGTLIERHQKAVASLLLTVLHDWNAAEEAAQQAFVKAFKSLQSFEGRSSFKTWVSRIALNVAKSQLRWAKLRNALLSGSLQDSADADWEEKVRGLAPSGDDLDAVEKKLELERSMAGLTLREREMAAMRLEGYTLAEIAEALGVTEGTVKSTVFEATRKMRRKLS